MAIENAEKRLLEFTDDEKLMQLEDALSRFNIFEAIGATNEELRHSNFLAYLLDPTKNHGLGGRFARDFLTRVLPELDDGGSFEHIKVYREYRYIDILIIDSIRGFAIIIENKIWSGETGDQLKVYWKLIKQEFPDLERRGIFLTPSGQKASCEKYQALSYRVIAEVLDGIVSAGDSGVLPGVRVAIEHYVDMLRRFIVGNAGTGELSRQIYTKHKQAIEQMNPLNWQRWVKSYLESLIMVPESQFDLDAVDLAYIRFGVTAWDSIPALKSGIDWTGTGRIALFDFYNFPDSLTLHLFIGPGPEEARQKLCELSRKNKPPFSEPRKTTKWWRVYDFTLLESADYEKLSDQDLLGKIDARWKYFVDADFPRIREVFEQIRQPMVTQGVALKQNSTN